MYIDDVGHASVAAPFPSDGGLASQMTAP